VSGKTDVTTRSLFVRQLFDRLRVYYTSDMNLSNLTVKTDYDALTKLENELDNALLLKQQTEQVLSRLC